jgi:hypothetical protein
MNEWIDEQISGEQSVREAESGGEGQCWSSSRDSSNGPREDILCDRVRLKYIYIERERDCAREKEREPKRRRQDGMNKAR